MADDMEIAKEDVVALGEKLDAMGDQFTDDERAVLEAVFHMAGSVLHGDPEVVGFSNTDPAYTPKTTGARSRRGSASSGFTTGLQMGWGSANWRLR